MVVISTTAVPEHVRGALTRWLTEPAPGLYVGTVSARVRDGLWSAVATSVGDGAAVCVHPAENEQRYLIRTAGKRRRKYSTPTVSSSYASPPKNTNLPPKPAARKVSSPHPRGWSGPVVVGAGDRRVVPAPAGVVRTRSALSSSSVRRPRTRGVVRVRCPRRLERSTSSPHPRGWSVEVSGGLLRRRVVPAPAGVVRATEASRITTACRPRTRGGGPYAGTEETTPYASSPHPRGWSARVAAEDPRPGRRPRTRGGGPYTPVNGGAPRASSPHPRGWSLQRRRYLRGAVVVPAPAGVVRSPNSPGGIHGRRPRTRGGGPLVSSGTICSVMSRPRTRGGGPHVLLGGVPEMIVVPAPAGGGPITTSPLSLVT